MVREQFPNDVNNFVGQDLELLSDVCFLRLDFEQFTILGTGGMSESNGGECQDKFAITVGK